MSDLPAEAVQAAKATCQAFDMGYPRECTQRARYRAEKHQALPFDLCSQHLNRAWRAGYRVGEIDFAGERSTPTPVQEAPEATQGAEHPPPGVPGSLNAPERISALRTRIAAAIESVMHENVCGDGPCLASFASDAAPYADAVMAVLPASFDQAGNDKETDHG
jgi:hypothetical protein